MLRPLALLVYLALALTALGVASTAAAKPSFHVQERSLTLMLFAKASHGYTLWAATDGHRQVTLTLSRSGTSATYTTTGRVSRKGIEANFGELGEISVRFRGKLQRTRRPSPRIDSVGGRGRGPTTVCRGRRPQRAFGSFHGTIRFRGENGFANVKASKAPGLMSRSYRRVCKRERAPLPKPKPKEHSGQGGKQADEERSILGDLRSNLLTVGGETEGQLVAMRAASFTLAASEDHPGLGFTILVGATLERHDGIRIERSMFTLAGANGLEVSGGEGGPTRVGVVFPKPFVGRAKLMQEKGERSIWSGTLGMRLPGAGAVPLTGPGLAAVFCRISLLRTAKTPCMRRSEALLPAEWLSGSPRLAKLLALQESGSHSQALADVKLSWSR